MPRNSYNRVILLGHLIDQHTIEEDLTPVTYLTLQLHKTTITCRTAGKIAQTVKNHAAKGQQLHIEGRLQHHPGQARGNTIHVDNLQFTSIPPKTTQKGQL